LDRYGTTPTGYMAQAGIFERPLLAAHGIYLTDQDMELFRQSGAFISYNPVSNLKLCDGILPLKKLRQHGVGISMGIDGAQSNNSLDLLSDLKTGVLIQKMQENDPTFLTAQQAVRMATIEGAKAIGMEMQIGSLEPGKRADLIALDSGDTNLTPCLNNFSEQLYSHIVYSASGMNVSDVFVDGRQLLADKKPLLCDPDQIRCEATRAAQTLYQKWINR
jgi:5-methylthioadenosine/S-adenosylhomocysteine deaminase